MTVGQPSFNMLRRPKYLMAYERGGMANPRWTAGSTVTVDLIFERFVGLYFWLIILRAGNKVTSWVCLGSGELRFRECEATR
jgi:hypothetical protein